MNNKASNQTNGIRASYNSSYRITHVAHSREAEFSKGVAISENKSKVVKYTILNG